MLHANGTGKQTRNQRDRKGKGKGVSSYGPGMNSLSEGPNCSTFSDPGHSWDIVPHPIKDPLARAERPTVQPMDISMQ